MVGQVFPPMFICSPIQRTGRCQWKEILRLELSLANKAPAKTVGWSADENFFDDPSSSSPGVNGLKENAGDAMSASNTQGQMTTDDSSRHFDEYQWSIFRTCYVSSEDEDLWVVSIW